MVKNKKKKVMSEDNAGGDKNVTAVYERRTAAIKVHETYFRGTANENSDKFHGLTPSVL